MKSEHIQGLTILAAMNDLDPALVREAEVDAALLPIGAAAFATDPYTRKKARREAREARREANPFLRFMGSGAGAAAVSLVVALGLIAGIVFAVNRAPTGGENPPAAGVAPGSEAAPSNSEAATRDSETTTLGEGKIPVGEIDAAYTISTNIRLYDTSPTRISVTMRAKEPGVEIAYFQSFHIESLTDPDGELSFDYFWTEEDVDRVGPVGADEYDAWTKSVNVDGVIPPGVYRIHHMEYIHEQGTYVSAAFCDFAVGAEYGAWVGVDDAGETADSSHQTESTPPVPAHSTAFSLSVPDVMQYGTDTLTVTFRATELGKSLVIFGSPVLEKISGAPDAGTVRIVPVDLATEVLPAAPDEYAEWTHTYTIENAHLMQDGTYLVSMEVDGVIMASVEFWLNTAVDE